MQAIIESATGRTLYLFADGANVQITTSGLAGPDVRALDIKPETHEVVTAPEPPGVWLGGVWRWDGAWSVADQARYDEFVAEKLEAAKAAAVTRINAEAGAERAKRITVTIGQEGTYIEKGREAAAFVAGGSGTFPYLEAEAIATNSTVADVAALVNATAAAWVPINASIEGKRRGALVAVDAAQTDAEVEAIFPIAWPA